MTGRKEVELAAETPGTGDRVPGGLRKTAYSHRYANSQSEQAQDRTQWKSPAEFEAGLFVRNASRETSMVLARNVLGDNRAS